MKSLLVKTHMTQKMSSSGKKITYIEGIANKAVVDRINDYIPPEAWDLKNFERLPMIFFNHDRNQPIGKAVSVKVKEDGLHIKARLSTSDDPGIKRVRDLVEEDILSAFSVGINPRVMEEKTLADGQKVNVLKDVELLEVSVVSLPMNQESFFSLSTKDLGAMTDEKFVETKNLLMKEDAHPSPPAESKDAFQDCVSSKIPALLDEGMPKDQAIAVAMSKCREGMKEGDSCVIDYAKIEAVCATHKKPEDKQTIPEAAKAEGDGSGLPNNEAAPSDPMKVLSESQVALLGAILNELKLMTEKLANLQMVEEVSTSENETEAAKIQKARDDMRRQRLDLLSNECDKLLKRYGI